MTEFLLRCLHVVDAFVNSQEWTVSRKLCDIRLVISYGFAKFVLEHFLLFYISMSVSDIYFLLWLISCVS